MRASVWICAAIAGMGMLGCESFTPQVIPLTATKCENTRTCVIPVTVVDCNVTIPADQYDIEMKGRYVPILWALTHDSILKGYLFDPNIGVELKANTPDTDQIFFGKQFSAKGPVFNQTAYGWLDKNSNWKTYNYTITIINPKDPAHPCTLDPHVINN